MTPIHGLLATLCMLSIACVAHASTWDIACFDAHGGKIVVRDNPADEQREAQRIAEHADVVRRVSPHELQITTGNGGVVLMDRRPFAEDNPKYQVVSQLGTFYNYCGGSGDFHLIDSEFSQFMIDTRTGTRIPSLSAVLFSPDRHAYLTASGTIETAEDESDWEVHYIDGRKSYSGHDVLDSDKPGVRAALIEPRWTARGELTASARCTVPDGAHGAVTNVTLIKSAAGTWRWSPTPRCH